MSYEDGAAFIIAFGTTYHALKQRGNLQKGDTLLVLGAAGGVGRAAVELGRVRGARVIAACSTQEKLDLCLARGADGGVIYPRAPFDKDGKKALSNLLKLACGPSGPNVIYDAVGGEYAEASSRDRLGGAVPGSRAWTEHDPKSSRENSAELLQLYSDGKIKPHISAVYPLLEGSRALADLAERRAQGKVVIRCT